MDTTTPPAPRYLRAWLFLAAAVIAEVTGSLSLKAALDTSWFYLLVVVAYATAFTCLAQVLKAGIAIGVAYGIWGATGVALTAVMSFVLFGEPLTLLMSIGILVIVAGVLCIELGSQHATKHPKEATR